MIEELSDEHTGRVASWGRHRSLLTSPSPLSEGSVSGGHGNPLDGQIWAPRDVRLLEAFATHPERHRARKDDKDTTFFLFLFWTPSQKKKGVDKPEN